MSVQFSAETMARIEAIARRYPRRQAALLPVLHLAQHELGCLSSEVQILVAQTLDVPPVTVREVVTFYEMFHEHKEAQFHLEICTNMSCHLAGADELVHHCKKKLGVEVGHQTSDGVFGLMEAECLGSCGSGPMMKVGADYYEYLTPAALDHLLEQFKKAAPGLEGKSYVMGAGGPQVGAVSGFEPKQHPGTPVAAVAAPKAPPVPAPVPKAPMSAPPPSVPAAKVSAPPPAAVAAKVSAPPPAPAPGAVALHKSGPPPPPPPSAEEPKADAQGSASGSGLPSFPNGFGKKDTP